MAEAIGLAASVLGIAAFGAKLSMSLYEYTSTIRHARKQVGDIAQELTLFSTVLQQVGIFLEAEQGEYSDDLLESTRRIVDECRTLFRRLRRGLKRAQKKGNRSGRYLRNVSWLFDKPKALEMKAALEGLKTTLMLMMQTVSLAKKASKADKQFEVDVGSLKKEIEVLKSLIVANHQTILDLGERHRNLAMIPSQRERNSTFPYPDPPPPTTWDRPEPPKGPNGTQKEPFRPTETTADSYTSPGIHRNDPSQHAPWRDAPVIKYTPGPGSILQIPGIIAPSTTDPNNKTSPPQFSGVSAHDPRVSQAIGQEPPIAIPIPVQDSRHVEKADAVNPVIKVLSERVPHAPKAEGAHGSASPENGILVLRNYDLMTSDNATSTLKQLLDRWTTAGSACLTNIPASGKRGNVGDEGGKRTPGRTNHRPNDHDSKSPPSEWSGESDRDSTDSNDATETDSGDETFPILSPKSTDDEADDAFFRNPRRPPYQNGAYEPVPPEFRRPGSPAGAYGFHPRYPQYAQYAQYAQDYPYPRYPPQEASRQKGSHEWLYRHMRDRTADLDSDIDDIRTEYQRRISKLENSLKDISNTQSMEKEKAAQTARNDAVELCRVFEAWRLPGGIISQNPANPGSEHDVDLLSRMQAIGKGDIVWKRCSPYQQSFYVGPRPYFNLKLSNTQDLGGPGSLVHTVEIGVEWVRREVLALFGYAYDITDGFYRIMAPLTYAQIQLLVRNSFQLTLNSMVRNCKPPMMMRPPNPSPVPPGSIPIPPPATGQAFYSVPQPVSPKTVDQEPESISDAHRRSTQNFTKESTASAQKDGSESIRKSRPSQVRRKKT